MLPVQFPSAVQHGWQMLKRDLEKVLGAHVIIVHEEKQAQIVIRWAQPVDYQCPQYAEGYMLKLELGAVIEEPALDKVEGELPDQKIDLPIQPSLHIVGRDVLGLVYGMLHVSEHYLGVDPFWFWGDVPPKGLNYVDIDMDIIVSKQSKVKYRGWFVNDEVCLIGWTEQYPPPREVWHPVFEALLRCGGNMVIPGTDLPREGIHTALAQEMGLWVTHHHAEPLGAEMFLRAYPGLQPSYKEHPHLFEKLWQEAIDKQCHENILWVLSFRGQGDKPFWEDDPAFDTSEARGGMISRVIAKQYEMISAKVTEPVCCIALYGEIAELYKGGYVTVPDGVIKIWADNGYGKMVSRRHGNINYRVPALPQQDDKGLHGIYYHVTFHDLQASNHLTMQAVHPSLVQAELAAIAKADAMSYLLVNCGNIRQHLFQLKLLSSFWLTGDSDYRSVLQHHIDTLYGKEYNKVIAELYERYWSNTIAYGKHQDDRAGDEYYHHTARIIIGHWLQGKSEASCPALYWATGEVPFAEQVRILRDQALNAIQNWKSWCNEVSSVIEQLSQEAGGRLHDHLLFHGQLHLSGSQGLYTLCESYLLYNESKHPQSFVRASQSMHCYRAGVQTLREAEHGKWHNFYRADWLTNIQLTVEQVDTVRKFVRMHGDNPDFFLWYKAYLMPETEKYIYLENTHRNPLSDDELAARLAEYFEMVDEKVLR